MVRRLIVPGGMTHKVPDRAPDPIIYRCQKAPRPARISIRNSPPFLGTCGNVNLITTRRFIGTPQFVFWHFKKGTAFYKYKLPRRYKPPFKMNSERSRQVGRILRQIAMFIFVAIPLEIWCNILQNSRWREINVFIQFQSRNKNVL